MATIQTILAKVLEMFVNMSELLRKEDSLRNMFLNLRKVDRLRFVVHVDV
jgi:hypothetical protein